MDLYLVAKFLHVACAALWLGGGLALMILAMQARRAGNREDMFTTIRLVMVLAPRVFMPGSILVLLFGLAMIWLGGLAWDAWIVFGMAGIAATAGLGMFRLGPLCERITGLTAAGEWAAAEAAADALIRAARVDYTLQFLIVFAMVVKPGWGDTGVLTAMLGLAALSALSLLAPGKAVTPRRAI